MRIAIVLHTFPVVSETFIVNQICSLIDNNHEVTIFALYKGNKTIIHKKITSYKLLDKVIYYNSIPANKVNRLGLGLKLFFKKGGSLSKLLTTLNIFKRGFRVLNLEHFYRAQWFLKKNKFDIIHCHFAQLGLFIAKLKEDDLLNNEKLITTFHGVDIAPEKINKYQENYQVLFKHMNVCTYNSEYSLQILKKINSNYIAYKFLPVGLDTNLFKPQRHKTDDEKINILFCGRLVPFKGPDVAIKIVQELLKRSFKIHLNIIGSGEMIDSLKQTIKENNLEHYITLKGSLSQEQIIDVMNQSDLFLLPGIVDNKGRAENQGLVIQEAQSMELPVVVSDAGGMKYGLVDTVTGFVVKSKSIKLFAEKIGLLIEDKQLRIKMGKAGRNHVVKTYDNQVLYQKLISYYKNA